MPVYSNALLINTDNLIEVKRLKDASNDADVNDATITAQVKNAAGAVIIGSTPIPVNYVSGSAGKYQGIIDKLAITASIVTENVWYYLELTGTAPGGKDMFRRIYLPAVYHGAKP